MRKFKSMEEMWQEVGWQPNVESFKAYLICHLEQIYLGTRHCVAVNINIFPSQEEGLSFINKCCETFNAKIIHHDKGEYWITHIDNPWQPYDIPSRFSNLEDDHCIRGIYLGYKESVIDSYFEDKESDI